MTDNRNYIVGATVILTVDVTLPNSQTPADANTVVLDGLYQGLTPVVISPNAFTSTGGSVWTFSLDTTGLSAGVYTWRARANTDQGVALKEDTFVLRAPFGS